MNIYRPPLEDMQFLMRHVFCLPQEWANSSALTDVIDEETTAAILEEAAKIAAEVIAPLNRPSDEAGSAWSNGVVTAPQGFKEAYQVLCEGGWCGLGGATEFGGMGMPKALTAQIEEMFQGASLSFGLAPMLTAGACLSLLHHGSDALKAQYLPKMYTGEWAGAMDLTEPHAGTDLGIIRTKAEPQGDGRYALSGTKIFITWGEHDLADNIIHLVLAKLPDAPAGSKGISLFLVPKFIPNADGTLGARNGYSCGSLEKKMGIKGSATCVMNYDGAIGWMVGEPNRGLAAMFTMMNYERLAVGIQGLGVAEMSYQNAVAYAKDRLQSRSAAGVVAPQKAADPIIHHADVRRMLMTMRAWNEGGRAFSTYVAMELDRAKFSDDRAVKQTAEARVALLTPVAKAFMTDRALETTVMGQQVLGGHGYIREWGQEQLVRDVRITQIYEGTNGIQAMDLIGRKVATDKGQALEDFLSYLQTDLQVLPLTDESQAFATTLIESIEAMRGAVPVLLARKTEDPHVLGAVAVDFLDWLGYISYGYLWIKMFCAAHALDDDVSRRKVETARFFFARLFPAAMALHHKVMGMAQGLSLAETDY